jgi:hypothetical protein
MYCFPSGIIYYAGGYYTSGEDIYTGSIGVNASLYILPYIGAPSAGDPMPLISILPDIMVEAINEEFFSKYLPLIIQISYTVLPFIIALAIIIHKKMQKHS